MAPFRLPHGALSLLALLLPLVAQAGIIPTTPSGSLNLLNDSLSDGDDLSATSRPICVTDDSWSTKQFRETDCRDANERFRVSTVLDKKLRLQFLADHAPPVGDLPILRLPKRWVKGTCTVALATTDDVGRPSLPRFPSDVDIRDRDTATWAGVRNSALATMQGCITASGNNEQANANATGDDNFVITTGYALAGQYQGIGVFIIGTGSVMDGLIPKDIIDETNEKPAAAPAMNSIDTFS